MRNFIVTIDGKQYQVGVEEVGATASPVVTEIKPAAPVAAATPAAPAAPAKPAAAAPTNGTKVNAPMPGMSKSLSKPEGSVVTACQNRRRLLCRRYQNRNWTQNH